MIKEHEQKGSVRSTSSNPKLKLQQLKVVSLGWQVQEEYVREMGEEVGQFDKKTNISCWQHEKSGSFQTSVRCSAFMSF